MRQEEPIKGRKPEGKVLLNAVQLQVTLYLDVTGAGQTIIADCPQYNGRRGKVT